MSNPERLAWAVARHVAALPAGTAFTATSAATLGVMLAQRLFASRLALWGHGGAYDPAGILSLTARHALYNRRPHARVTLPGVFETQSEPHVLIATPGQVDGMASANLSCVGDHPRPKVAFGGTRGLPDARAVYFLLPNHSPRQLVGKVDFVSTCAAARDTPPKLFTDLCVMDWSPQAGRWRLAEIAPETSLDTLRARTGFVFDISPGLKVIDAMPEAAQALVGQFDPMGVRRLDFITDRTALFDAFEEIHAAEIRMIGEIATHTGDPR